MSSSHRKLVKVEATENQCSQLAGDNLDSHEPSEATVVVCTPKQLPTDLVGESVVVAGDVNLANFSPMLSLVTPPSGIPHPEFIAALATKYWGAKGVRLSVAFLDNPSIALRKRILLHMNAWNKMANVRFSEGSLNTAEVRIARAPGDGYWSYLGTDVRLIPKGQATMNLDSFSMNTPESEYRRVIRHETGHTLGFPHEHMRREIVARIDPNKAYAYFARYAGWSKAMVKSQVLTPIEEGSLIATTHSDPNSIMCYQLPGSIMKDGQAVKGGSDIDQSDFDFVRKLYPVLS